MVANSCASTLRYYEGRDDFNFLKSSRIRLGYYDGDVTLEVCVLCALDHASQGTNQDKPLFLRGGRKRTSCFPCDEVA